MDLSEILMPFLGALQASLAVLLTIYFGVLTRQFGLLSTDAAKEVSKFCVRMSLPALLIYKLGSQLHLDTLMNYVPILIWATAYHVVSLVIGIVTTKFFQFPSWVTPALAFNNTTSLPLLLLQSLESTSILDSILKDGDSVSLAIGRATSYFLVNAMVSNCLRFAAGPRLLKPGDEDADSKEGDEETNPEDEAEDGDAGENGQTIDEQTSLLPRHVVNKTNNASWIGTYHANRFWKKLPPWTYPILSILKDFLNAPLLGALTGAFIGLVPPLHRAFFNGSTDGGFFRAWLTSAIKNVGELFASLQIVVVGVKLSQSLMHMKNGQDSGHVPMRAMAFITVVRFLIWPAISISTIYLLAAHTSVLGDDPMLWLSMMIMPTGPPAMLLTALADLSGASEEQKMGIAKFLTMQYTITPIISATVVGALKAVEAVMKR